MRITVGVGLASVLVVRIVAAQSDRFASIVLQLPATPRGASMAGADLTDADQGVLFSNPAQLALAGSRGLELSAGRVGSAGTVGSLAAVAPLGGAGGVGIGVQLLQYTGPLDPAPVPARALGARGAIAAGSVAATIGGSTTVHDTRFGLAVKFAGEERGGSAGGGAGVDLSVAREIGAQRQSTVAFVAQNLGPAMTLAGTRTPMPRRLSVSAGIPRYEAGPIDLRIEGMVSLLRDGSVAPAIGGEAGFGWLEGYDLALRAGVRRADRLAGESTHASGTVGAGLSADRLSLDYAFAREAGIAVHRIGLRLR